MNLYDMRSIHCETCDNFIGEIESDSAISSPKCYNCIKLKTKVRTEEDKIQTVSSEPRKFSTTIPLLITNQTISE